ncbi:hypothetical protein SH668x_001932 [Planctomicrobium sp. SH668]|uniref:hypothetical protein n=1 Tax=Planctomicrobium sp. SH668 TaxID=3448126 RepID=UPI003F5B7628
MSQLRLFFCLAACVVSVQTVKADWPFFTNGSTKRGTPEYYAERASDPPGARQLYRHGKLWPPVPRPVGPNQLFVHRYHTAHYWPHPYICDDREAVNAIAYTQVQNGWLKETTLYSYHFDPVSNELNSSGVNHLRWIMMNVPVEYRSIAVANDYRAEVTAARASNVERELVQLMGANSGIQVATRYAEPVGRPAKEVQAIFEAATANAPPPILSTLGEPE